MEQRYHYIGEDGSIKRLRIIDDGIVLAREATLKAMVPDQWSFKGNIGRIGNSYVHLGLKGGEWLAVTRLYDMKIRCRWTRNGTTLVPNIIVNPNAPAGGQEVTRDWRVPADIEAYFGLLDVAGGRTWYYWWQMADDEWKRPPIPNLYDDGKLCLGTNGISGVTTMEIMERSVDVFQSAAYGSHLHPPDNVFEDWFKYEVVNDKAVQVEATAEMRKQLKTIDTGMTLTLNQMLNTPL